MPTLDMVASPQPWSYLAVGAVGKGRFIHRVSQPKRHGVDPKRCKVGQDVHWEWCCRNSHWGRPRAFSAAKTLGFREAIQQHLFLIWFLGCWNSAWKRHQLTLFHPRYRKWFSGPEARNQKVRTHGWPGCCRGSKLLHAFFDCLVGFFRLTVGCGFGGVCFLKFSRMKWWPPHTSMANPAGICLGIITSRYFRSA